VLIGFPLQCRGAVRLRPAPALSVRATRLVVIAGMGGSATSGDLLASCGADRLDVPVLVHRGYGLPALAGKDTLVIASSYSGDTAEVLSAVDVALARGLPVVVLTAGGKLADVAAARKLPHVVLPAGFMPRMALGYLFFPLLAILESLGLTVATEGEIAEALDTVEALGSELCPGRGVAENEAKRLALAIGTRLPAIYGGPTTGPVAYRWKTDFEENVKAFALAGTLPEMNHNELEAWRAPGARGMYIVLLRDREEPPEIELRFTVLRELIAPAADGVSESWTRGTGRLARLLSLTHVGQWMSYYVAVLRGVDPWTVPLLDELKRRLGGAS
jgi:glucose/mannose-6-phosphate isomerase